MVFPKEKYEEIEQLQKEAELEKIELLKDTEVLKSPDGSDFYLPKDPERQDLIKRTLNEIDFLQKQFIKDEIDPLAQNLLIYDLLQKNGVSYEEITGQYESSIGAKSKAFVNSMNTRIAQSLDNFVDVMWTPKDKITQSGAYAPDAKELGIEADPGLFEEFFTWAGSIDPTFTPKTMGERIADKAGAGAALGLELAIPTSRLSTSGKIVIDPTTYAGVVNKTKNTAKATWNGILDIYQKAAKDENLSAALLADIMAFAGWDAGVQLGEELVGKGTTSDSQFTEGFKNGVLQWGAPFVGGMTGGGLGYSLWGVPKATWNGFSKLFTEYFPEVIAKYQAGETINPFTNYKENYNLKKANKNKKKAAEIIQSNLTEEQLAEREAAKLIEEEIPGLNLSLAQQTENPTLVEQQKVIEDTLTELGSSPPIIATGGRKEQTEQVGKNLKQNIIKNFEAVDDAVKQEFPDKQTIFRTDEAGNVVEVDKEVGNFFSYVNKKTGAGDTLVKDFDEQIAAAERELVPGEGGLLPKISEDILSESGKQIRTEVKNIKDKTGQYYNNELLRIYETEMPNQKFDITEFKDDIITTGALRSFEDPDNLPRQYLELKDLGKEFESIIVNTQRQMDSLYENYINSGQNNARAYEDYLTNVQKLEKDLAARVQNLNEKLAGQKIAGERSVAPEYDIGEIVFKYPEFGSGTKVGEGYLGRKDVNLDRPGEVVSVTFNEPALNLKAKDMLELKQSVNKDIDLLSTDLYKNSDKIQRLAQINQQIDDLFRNELKDSQDYQKWLQLYEQNYKVPFEEGIVNKVLTQTGTGGEYLIGSEVVGKAFLKDVPSIRRYFEIFGGAIQDGNLEYVEGIKNSFLDEMYKKILTPQGLIDSAKLKKFEAANRETIDILNEYIPDLRKIIDNNIELGNNVANRIKDLKQRKIYAGKVELDDLAQRGLGEGLTFEDSQKLIKNALKDPDQMKKTVQAIQNSPESDAMMAAFKNEIFKEWIDKSKSRVFKGKFPQVSGMNSWLEKNEVVIKSFFDAINDPKGYDRLNNITKAYDKLNLTGYPGQADATKPSIIKRVFGSDIPQILSRVFAVQSGRTSSRFVGAELGMRFFRQLDANKRQKVIAEALYDKDVAEALLKVMTGDPLNKKDVNLMKGILGQVQGWMSNTIDDEILQDQQKQLQSDAKAITTTSSLDQGATGVAPKLNIPGVSPASSLSGINISGAMTPATTPNTLQKGQALFGANDPIFGGIGSVS